jgi:hypothetical protein
MPSRLGLETPFASDKTGRLAPPAAKAYKVWQQLLVGCRSIAVLMHAGRTDPRSPPRRRARFPQTTR